MTISPKTQTTIIGGTSPALPTTQQGLASLAPDETIAPEGQDRQSVHSPGYQPDHRSG
jgi:hypothetical protein